jgi:hypothetical protein
VSKIIHLATDVSRCGMSFRQFYGRLSVRCCFKLENSEFHGAVNLFLGGEFMIVTCRSSVVE